MLYFTILCKVMRFDRLKIPCLASGRHIYPSNAIDSGVRAKKEKKEREEAQGRYEHVPKAASRRPRRARLSGQGITKV
jgi:hypothetical protein